MPRGDFNIAVQQVLERTDIVDIISEYVQLKKSGRDAYSGLCPFHEETAPSFSVNRAKGVYYCFGCKASGNAITFLSEMLGISRGEAISKLAERTGVQLPQYDRKHADVIRHDRDVLRQVMDITAREFRGLLGNSTGKIARQYLDKRKMAPDTIERFGLGFGGGTGDLVGKLRTIQGGLRMAASCGVVNRGPDTYNRFHSRLVFPIRSSDGTVVGFSGRWLGEGDAPKYLNTSENPLFHKGKLLFGLDQARQSIRKSGYTILVEGNFDVLAMHQNGFANTVAPLGTSVTHDQIRTIARLGRRLVVLFDGDSAGRKAALRLAGLCAQAGVDGRVAVLPRGEDPDSMLAAGRKNEIRKAVDEAIPIFDYYILTLQAEYGTGPDAITLLAGRLRELTSVVKNRLTLEAMIDRAARLLRVDRRNLARTLYQTRQAGDARTTAATSHRFKGPEADLVEWMLRDPGLTDIVIENGGETLISDPQLADLVRQLILAYEEGNDFAGLVADSDVPSGLKDRLMSAVMDTEPVDRQTSAHALNQVLLSLELRNCETRLRKLTARIKNGDGEDGARKQAWELSRRINALRMELKRK